ncbi:tRNA adenosine deaminase-associated protein [Corynebacterium sp. sy039]|uniref:tRNA adenosine deaminase-associated protein n=1 Tax=Corynebacterium sp. sy039 TaxID=2599641 RepID=UPI0011B47465|nr:tRNA adenosine deaminase-associated protein [Corynebacterium sp. sy039]QDZ41923.1 tRNA adenosine deaminase [Corynebacterium sp. sy039]
MKHDFAVTVARVDAQWQVRTFADDFRSITTAIQAVRDLRAQEAAFALLSVDDDYFVIVRPTPKGVRLLLSDATAAIDDDYAAAILEELAVEMPDIDSAERDAMEPWAEGDFAILADLGLSEQVMNVICDETDWWASEQLQRIAEELGFEEEFNKVVGL